MALGRLISGIACGVIATTGQAAAPAVEAPGKPIPLTAPYDPLSAEVQKEALAWVTKNAHPLEVPTDDPCSKPLLDPATLKPMADALAKPRVIGIGELSHGDCESFAFKASLIRALVLYEGVTLIGMEATIEGGRQLDAFIAPGQPLLSGAALVAATDKALLAANVFGIWKTVALRDLLVWLRVHNQTAAMPVHFANFDTQHANGDSQYAVRFLNNALAKSQYRVARYAAFRQKLSVISKEIAPILALPSNSAAFYDYLEKQNKVSFAVKRAAADRLVQLFGEAPLTLKRDPGFGLAERSAYSFAASMDTESRNAGVSSDEITAEQGGEDPSNGANLAIDFIARDRGMAGNVLRALRQYPGTKMILWAHNAHVSRANFYEYGVNALTMGQNLHTALYGDYTVVDFVAYQGRYNPVVQYDENGKSQPASEFPFPANPYSLGAFYSKVEQPRFWLDLRKLPYSTPWVLAWRRYPYVLQEGGAGASKRDIYLPYVSRPIGFSSDITVFFNTIHPTVRLAAPKATP